MNVNDSHELPPRCRCGAKIPPRFVMCDDCFRKGGPPLPPDRYNSRPDKDTRTLLPGEGKHRYGVTPPND